MESKVREILKKIWEKNAKDENFREFFKKDRERATAEIVKDEDSKREISEALGFNFFDKEKSFEDLREGIEKVLNKNSDKNGLNESELDHVGGGKGSTKYIPIYNYVENVVYEDKPRNTFDVNIEDTNVRGTLKIIENG